MTKTLEECLEFLKGIMNDLGNPTIEQLNEKLEIINNEFNTDHILFRAGSAFGTGGIIFKVRQFLDADNDNSIL